MSFLLDTCVLAEAWKPRPDQGGAAWLGAQVTSDLFLSTVTVGELWKGAAWHPDEVRRRKLVEWLERVLPVEFYDRILPFNVEVSRTWGLIQGEALRKGQPLPVLDSMIAATARVHGLTVVTRNVRDFHRTGVHVFNPWETKA